MLILTRRVGESIVVGDDIVLTVFEVRGDAVRVGIEAPRSVQVHRQEVYDELKRLNEQSVSPSDDAVDALRDALDSGSGGPDRVELSLVADPTEDADQGDTAGKRGTAGRADAAGKRDTAGRADAAGKRDTAGRAHIAGEPHAVEAPTPAGTPSAAGASAGRPTVRSPKPGPRPPARA